MEIKEIKKNMRAEIGALCHDVERMDKDYLDETINKIFDKWRRRNIEVDNTLRNKVIKELTDDFTGYGPITELFNDKSVTEIMINGPYQVYVERNGRKELADIRFDDVMHLNYIVERMISPSGRRVDESSPYTDFSMPDGSRVNIIIPPVSAQGAVVTIRKFLHTIEKIEDLTALGTIDERMAKFLVACVKSRLNILFSGAAGSGKTTTLGVLSSYIGEEERIITIEDTLELDLQQKHIVRLITKPANIDGKGEITPRDLFANSLRMRPSRIILGEIRGVEALDYLQALNSGHKGSLAVLHASTPQGALMRLETMALYADLNLPAWIIRKQISSGLDLIVQHEQFADGSRKITYVTEVSGISGNNEIILRDIFRYEIAGVDDDNKSRGKFIAVDKPLFYHVLGERGVHLDEEIFKE